MNVVNLTSDYIHIGHGISLEPLATVVVNDDLYNKNDIFAAVINSMYAAGRINVTSPPSPFPRSGVHTGSEGGVTDHGELTGLTDDDHTQYLQSTETAGIDGWVNDTAATWTRTANQTFTVSGDRTAIFSKNTKLKWTQTTVKYGVVASSSHSAGTTTVTIATNTDHVLTAAAISENYYSYAISPAGYPVWFNFSPTYAGFSSDPSSGICRFAIVGNICIYKHTRNDGTSNATNFTISLPIAAINSAGAFGSIPFPIRIKNNGTNATVPGMAEVTDSATMALHRDWNGLTWTASGAKNAIFTVQYEI